MEKFNWLNKEARTFLKRGYLAEGQEPEDRVKVIAERAEELTKIDGFADKFYDYMSKGYYSLSSPVWSNYGTDRGLPVSCFNSHLGDSMEDILFTTSEVGMLSKFGGGTSGYIGDLRPRGSLIQKDGSSFGSVHFMELFDTLTNVVSQGCYDASTEVLTDKGWRLFSEVIEDKTLKVAQVTDEDKIEFVTPLDYMAYEVDENLIRFSDGKNIDILVTKNHNMEFKYERKVFDEDRKSYSREVVPEYRTKVAEAVPTHRDVKFVFSSRAREGAGLTPKEQLLVAFQADGSQGSGNSETSTRFRFSKERKAKRLEQILKDCEIEYAYSFYEKDQTYNYYFNTKEIFPKNLSDWVNLEEVSYQWAADFLHEVANWDSNVYGDYGSYVYSSIIKDNVDTVQAVASLCDWKCYVSKDDRTNEENKSPIYKASVSYHKYFGVEKLEPKEEHYKGFVYCVEVPSNRLIVRSNGRTLVCGNSVRRGFFSPYLPIEHKDFDEFVGIGSEGHPIQNLTHGITVTDEFMDKMIAGDEDKRTRWAKVIQKRGEVGYPYIFFKDNVNRQSVDVYKNTSADVKSSNMCTEITLPSTEDESFVCVLSSMNLLHYDSWKDTDAVETLTIFLDTVVTEFLQKIENMTGKKRYFMERVYQFAKRHRALGLGVLGWHSYLQSNMIPFESLEASKLNSQIFKNINDKAWKASQEMASMWGEPELLKGYGRRNTTLTAIAPTKSSSYILGQVSQSIEPEFSNFYIKDLAKVKQTYRNPYLVDVLEKHGSNTAEVWVSIKEADGSVQHLEFLTDVEKEVFKTIFEINPEAILNQAAVRQGYVDQAQSLNLMIDPKTSAKDINKLYITAWQLGIKTLYYQYSLSAAQAYMRDKYMNKQGCAACEA